jgi:hypothetical protein
MAARVSQAEVEVIVPGNDSVGLRYVDWGAIFGGAFIALAISTVFVAFGAAIGLSVASLELQAGFSLSATIVAASLWWLWIQVSSFLGGGYLAGRLRRKISDAPPSEVSVRDGAHGLVVWAITVVAGTILAAWLASFSPAVPKPADYYADLLFRTEVAASSSSLAVGSNDEVSRILTKSAVRPVTDVDRSYLVSLVVRRTGLAEDAAQTRVDQTLSALKAEADRARRMGILVAFLTAATLLVGALAGWWGAVLGGEHRDRAIDHGKLARWS